jgi:hypothetical protein
MSETPTAVCRRCGARVPTGRLSVCARCALEADLAPATIGDSLELVEEIGSGGMGTVWKARQLRLGRTVAVKFLASRLLDEREFAERFEREAQALARMSHSRIVAVHDFGGDEGRPYIVMEYVDGRPLSQCLPLPPPRVRAVGLDVLDALEYAHARGVVHRDIKPENVLIEADGRAKVTDFGIARLLGDRSAVGTVTTAGRLVGTPAYMPPEALAGAPPDPRMDVFAVGVLLHEALTGRRPAGRSAGVPPALLPIIDRAIAADPAARYPSAAAMKAELAAVRLEDAAGDLPPDERQWIRAVALVQTLATAAVAWAFLLSVTPRVLTPGDVQPLIMLETRVLPDGRVVSYGRFETGPTLAAVALLGIALAAQGLLRRHWRDNGLDVLQPDRPVSESRVVLGIGAVVLGLYIGRRLWAPEGALWRSYLPILGGTLELVVVFLAWSSVLQAWRTSRPLTREPRLWLGIALALVPPVVDLAAYLRHWTP